jgi:hypothetical protein
MGIQVYLAGYFGRFAWTVFEKILIQLNPYNSGFGEKPEGIQGLGFLKGH